MEKCLGPSASSQSLMPLSLNSMRAVSVGAVGLRRMLSLPNYGPAGRAGVVGLNKVAPLSLSLLLEKPSPSDPVYRGQASGHRDRLGREWI